MDDTRLEGPEDEGATIEIRVYRDGELVAVDRCEGEDEAAARVEFWDEADDVDYEIVDLTAPPPSDESLEAAPAIGADDVRVSLDDDPGR